MPSPSASISLPIDVQNQIMSYSQQIGLDWLVAAALAQVLSGGQNLTPAGNGAQGVMQMTPAIGNNLGFDVTIPLENIQCGLTYLLNQYQTFENYTFAVAAYLSDPSVVFQYNGIPPFSNIQELVYNVAALAQRAGSFAMSIQSVLNSQTKGDPSSSSTTVSALADPTDSAPPTSDNSLSSGLQVNEGMNLAALPWYNNNNLLTGNIRIRQSVQPLTFTVYLNQYTGVMLTNPSTGQPITLELNTSLTQMEIQSKHVYNRTPSRTGQHITFWGMQPDLIVGSGSTGVFMNQFGITDFFSVAQVNSDIQNLVISGFSHSSPITSSNGPSEVYTSRVDDPTTFSSIVQSQTANPDSAFRVAAQDAFMEFLKLFQMNGNVWYYNPGYTNFTAGQEQTSPSTWSPQSGVSSWEQNARNNDVQTRGYVAMKYKNNTYLGYFKSLSWSLDAEKPFQWLFNFSFQVERTYTALFSPTANYGPTQPTQPLLSPDNIPEPQPAPAPAPVTTSTTTTIYFGDVGVSPVIPNANSNNQDNN